MTYQPTPAVRWLEYDYDRTMTPRFMGSPYGDLFPDGVRRYRVFGHCDQVHVQSMIELKPDSHCTSLPHDGTPNACVWSYSYRSDAEAAEDAAQYYAEEYGVKLAPVNESWRINRL